MFVNIIFFLVKKIFYCGLNIEFVFYCFLTTKICLIFNNFKSYIVEWL